MDKERARRVRQAIDARALTDGMPPTVRHVCLACVDSLKMSGAGVILTSTMGLCAPAYASDPRAEQLAELQITVGEGPGAEAVRADRPVLVPDLRAADALRRWPMFAAQADALGVRAVFVFPLAIGAISVGVFEVSRDTPGWLAPENTADALLFADAALMVTLEPGDSATAGATGDGLVERWAEIHQATGMISAQLEVGLAQAFVRLRAYSFAHERRLGEVAGDVVARRLRFERDRQAGPDSTR